MTAQIHENLILNGKETSMTWYPSLPEHDPRIIELGDDPIEGDNIVFSTACWRQYLGTWEINNNKLYLLKLEGRFKITGDTPIFADWFTGTLKIPQGEMLEYVHMGYESIYEHELQIGIEEGMVTELKTFHNRIDDANRPIFW